MINAIKKFFETKFGQWLIDVVLFLAILFISWLLFYKQAILGPIWSVK